MKENCPYCNATFEYTRNSEGDIVVMNDSGCLHLRIDGPFFGFARVNTNSEEDRK